MVDGVRSYGCVSGCTPEANSFGDPSIVICVL